eukprot:13379936-Heterocapsa_arctica.AAC.1
MCGGLCTRRRSGRSRGRGAADYLWLDDPCNCQTSYWWLGGGASTAWRVACQPSRGRATC